MNNTLTIKNNYKFKIDKIKSIKILYKAINAIKLSLEINYLD